LVGFETDDYCRLGHEFILEGFFNAFYKVKERIPPNKDENKPHNIIKLIL
jgi:hypothetical protein